jgi:hypothetical protein
MRAWAKHFVVPACGFVCLLVLVLAGCAVGAVSSPALQVAAHLAALERSHAEARAIYHAHIDDVPAARRAEIERAWALVDGLATRLAVDDVAELLAQPLAARALAGLAGAAWQVLRAEARRLIEAGAIEPLQAARLVEMDRRVAALDVAMAQLAAEQAGGRLELLAVARDLAPLVALVARTVR